MSEEAGVTRGIFELFEMILPVAILLLIGAGIFFVAKPDNVRSYILEKEISYSSSLISENTVVELDLKNTKFEEVKVKNENNKVQVNIKKPVFSELEGSGSKYFGSGVKIEQKSENLIVISK